MKTYHQILNSLGKIKKPLQIIFLIILIVQTICLIIVYNDLNNYYDGKPEITIYYKSGKNFVIHNVSIIKNHEENNNLTEIFKYIHIVNNSIYPRICINEEHKKICKLVTQSKY